MNYYRNTEGYFDPTAGAALSKIAKEERIKRRKAMRQKNKKKRCQEVSKNVESYRNGSSNGNDSVAKPR